MDNREEILKAMWEELYKEEDKYERKFSNDPVLDVNEWFLFRRWFQLGHAIGINVVSRIMKEQPEIVRCGNCKKVEICCIRRNNDPDWFCADGEVVE